MAAAGVDGLRHLPDRIGGQAVQNQAGPFPGELMGDGLADAGAGARDNRDLVL